LSDSVAITEQPKANYQTWNFGLIGDRAGFNESTRFYQSWRAVNLPADK